MSLAPLMVPDFENLLKEAGFLASYRSDYPLAVAVSGGADSLALTLLLHDFVGQRSGKLTALTVDHGLRKESSQEAQSLHRILESRGITHHILTWSGEKPVAALQEKARHKRYDLLESWCFENQHRTLFLGHHALDQNETYCMRVRQGSGLLGLACMRPLTPRQRVTLVRPFLTCQKAQLEATLRARSLDWVEDPSNDNSMFERIFWRKILKDLPDFHPPISCFQGVRCAYAGWVDRYLNKNATLSPLGYLVLDKAPFQQLPHSFQDILFSSLLKTYGVGKYPPSTETLHRLIAKLKGADFTAATAHGLKISSHKKAFLVAREYKAITHEVPHGGKPFVWDKRFLIHIPKAAQGIVKAIGEKGWVRLLNHTPALKEIDIPRPVLWALPALFVAGEIHLKINMIHQVFQQVERNSLPPQFIFSPKIAL